MSSVTWRYLAGDTSSFAVEMSLVSSDVDDSMVDLDERGSWGTLALWVLGTNVCEHVAQGEQLRGAHWYLLPLAEWLVENWDPLLHEERHVMPDGGSTAARSCKRSNLLAELTASFQGDFSLAEKSQAWEKRHSLRTAAPGALLPDLYIRRYGDYIEFSTGGEPLAGADWDISFTQLQVARLHVDVVAIALSDALSALCSVLVKRMPDRSRIVSLQQGVRRLADQDRDLARFSWLSGAGDRFDEFEKLWHGVSDSVAPDLQARLHELAEPRRVAGGVACLAPPAALLFGSLSPDVRVADVVSLYRALLQTKGSAVAAGRLKKAGDQTLASVSLSGLTPGEQGSLLGEQAMAVLEEMGVVNEAFRGDVVAVISRLGIWTAEVDLQDANLRAVSMISADGTAGIVLNKSFRLGIGEPVRRFTLAHELGHLLLDRDRASRLIVASGPWAPVEIEKRANAFAAAFLIPMAALDTVSGWSATSPASIEYVREAASTLRVSQSALIGRLQNLGRLSAEEAEALRIELGSWPASPQ